MAAASSTAALQLKVGVKHRECPLIQMCLMLAKHIVVDVQRKSREHFVALMLTNWLTPQNTYEAGQKELAEKNVLI